MNTQLAIDFAPWVRGSITSFDAARAIEPKTPTLRQRVYEAIKANPATDEQVCHLLRLQGSTVRPRRIELVEAGLVRDSGRVAKTLSGRNAVIWECRLPAECPNAGTFSSLDPGDIMRDSPERRA